MFPIYMVVPYWVDDYYCGGGGYHLGSGLGIRSPEAETADPKKHTLNIRQQLFHS